MIKLFPFFMMACWTFISCGSHDNKTPSGPAARDTAAVKKQRFFPVTSFLQGELAAVRQKGVNPVKITKAGGKTDSTWLTLEQLGSDVADFMKPVIDSTNLIMLFKETSFQDQTINTFTFTHEPIGELPDSIDLRRWDVYIDADLQTVKRIYLVKQLPNTMQLTWETGKRCKMVTLDPTGNKIEKEVTILWDF